MDRQRAMSVAARLDTHSGRGARPLCRGMALLCVALSVTACVAQQADLVRLETTFKGTINDLIKARARIKDELRNLREEQLPEFQDTLETESRRLDQLTLNVETLAQRNADLETQLVELGTNTNQVLDQRNQAVQEQFVEFQQSLVQFRDRLESLETQLEEERNRGMDVERATQATLTTLTEAQRALHEKLNADTQALKRYLATDVRTAIESINTVLETNERALHDTLDARDAQWATVRTRLERDLAALRHTDVQYGVTLEDVTQSLAQLREALDAMAGVVGERKHGHAARLDRLERTQTQITKSVEQLHAALRSLRREFPRIELPTGRDPARQPSTP